MHCLFNIIRSILADNIKAKSFNFSNAKCTLSLKPGTFLT